MNQNNGTVNNGVINSTAETLTGIEKRQRNLKPFSELSPEEQRAIRSKGGKASQEKKRLERTMKEQAQRYLQAILDRETAEKYLGAEDADKLEPEDLTVQGVMIAKMAQAAMKDGNAKAAEFVRDTSGQAPKMQIDATVDTFSESDRALMDKIAQRLGILTDEKDG